MDVNKSEIGNDLKLLTSFDKLNTGGILGYYIQKLFKISLSDDIDLDLLMRAIESDSGSRLNTNYTDTVEKICKSLYDMQNEMKSAYKASDSSEVKKEKIKEVWNKYKDQLERLKSQYNKDELQNLIDHYESIKYETTLWAWSSLLDRLLKAIEGNTKQTVDAINSLKTKESSIEEITEESFNTHCMFAETSIDNFTVVNIDGREWVGSSDIILNFERLAINNKVGQNVLLKGAPGTGKTALAEAFVDAMIKRDGGTPEENKLLVVFNQNTDYADFICGLVPDRVNGGFKVQHGLFKKFCDEAAKHKDKMYYCIIDEFSRGNTEAILGEALVTLEKRDITVPLGKFTGETLMVPENVVIIATMNSVDRSTKYIDNATSNRFRTLKVNPIWQSDYCYDAITKIAFKDGIDSGTSECLNRVITVMQKIDSSISKKDNNSRIGTRALQNKLGNLENLKLSIETRLIPNIEYVSEMLGMNFEAELEELRELAK